MTSLPNPRVFMTSLINTLTAPIPPPVNLPTTTPYDKTINPLKNLPSPQRALLASLHVLLPQGMILQALDLLDRNLVTRLVLVPSNSKDAPNPQNTTEEALPEPQVYPPQAHIHLPPTSYDNPALPPIQPTALHEAAGRNTVYTVRSSQPTKGRYAATSAYSAGSTYTVRLSAWNCNCAAFTFSAFPGGGSCGNFPWKLDEDQDLDIGDGRREDEVGDEGWEFGAYSMDGVESDGVPVCKHLLACLLGERWESVLGGYVKVREVSRDEMAGYGAE